MFSLYHNHTTPRILDIPGVQSTSTSTPFLSLTTSVRELPAFSARCLVGVVYWTNSTCFPRQFLFHALFLFLLPTLSIIISAFYCQFGVSFSTLNFCVSVESSQRCALPRCLPCRHGRCDPPWARWRRGCGRTPQPLGRLRAAGSLIPLLIARHASSLPPTLPQPSALLLRRAILSKRELRE